MKGTAADIWGDKRPKSIACIGEAMVELSFDRGETKQAKVSVAGDVLNTAVYLRRNWSGEVAFVTAVGTDEMSERLLNFMAEESISTELVQRTDRANIGIYAISTDLVGERSFTYWRENSAARLLFQSGVGPDYCALERFDVIYLSAITLAILPMTTRERLIEWLSRFRRDQGIVVFDSNYRPTLWESPEIARNSIEEMWSITDIGLPSESDELVVFGELERDAIRRRLRKAGVTTGALKCEREGPVAIEDVSRPNSYFSVQSVLDSTAAGDSFNGAFLATWANGGTFTEAMMSGHLQAGDVLSHTGAFR